MISKAIVLSMAVTLFALVPGCQEPSRDAPRDFPVDTLDSVVQVGYIGLDAANPSLEIQWICSGVVVSRDFGVTRVLTAKHCSCDPMSAVAYPGKAFIRMWDQDRQEWSGAIAVDQRIDHPTRDITILKVHGEFGMPLPMADCSAELFSRVWNIGVSFYTGMKPNPTEGMISSTTVEFDQNGELVSTAPIVPGYSGGALLGWCADHQRWEVVGINSKVIVPAYGAAYHIAISVPVNDVFWWVYEVDA